jgi:DNA topoisomerase VI subunit B
MDKETKKKIIMRYVKELSADLADLAGTSAPADIEKKLINMIETKYEKIEGEAEEAVEEVKEVEENEKEE